MAYRSIATLAGGTRTNSAIATPAGLADNDILVFVLYVESNVTPSAPTPATFTQWSHGDSGGNIDTWIWWKRASGEAGGNYTANHASAFTEGVLLAFSGEETSGTPEDPAPTNGNTGSGTTITVTGLTSTIDLDDILYIGSYFVTGSTTAPSGTTPTFTERYDGGGDLNACTGSMSPAGATGAKTQTCPNGEWIGQLVSIKAAAAGGAANNQIAWVKG